MKDADYPPPIAFKPAIVELGIFDEDGKPVNSVVLNETSYEPPPVKGKSSHGKWQTIAIEALKKSQKEVENRLQSKGFDPDTARISLEDWRSACSDAGIKDRRIWKQVMESLSKNGTVIIENGFVVLS